MGGGGRATANFGGVRTWCHCGVLWLGGRVTAIFGGVDVVPLLGAIAGCYCSAMVGEREGDGQLSRVDVVPLLGGCGWGKVSEWTWCHCRVQCGCGAAMGASVMTNFGGVGVVP